jgi:hypothetical protein
MIKNKRVVCWTPYGREITMSVLVKYLARDHARGLVDEYWLYMNTDPTGQERDVEFAHELAERYDFVKLVHRPEGIQRHPGPKQRNTGFAYRHMTDPDTVYVRLDDDLVYVHEDAIENLVTKRLEMPHSTAIHGTQWNNAIVSYFAQAQGLIPREWGECSMFCMCPTGWANGEFAVRIHRLLLDKVEAGRAEDLYLYQDFPLQPGTQFSVSYFASMGSMYAELPEGPGVLIPDEEEHWHTVHRTLQTGVPNILLGNSLVSHFTFQPQRPHVMASDVLDRYRELADKL